MKHNLAVWGNPIKQSKSPQIHHFFAKNMGVDIQYNKKLGSDNFLQEITQFLKNGALGANITTPFKEDVIKIASILSERVKISGAANTIKIKNNEIFADNTDGFGLIEDLKRLNFLKKSQKILILGAGGATAGILYDLLLAEQDITLYNRTLEKAITLANKFAHLGQIKVYNLEQIKEQSFDLIINATSLGLTGKCIKLPKYLLENAFLYDLQYNLEELTPFLAYSSQFCKKSWADGIGMLIFQAAKSFEIWFENFPQFDYEKLLTLLKNKTVL